VFQNSHSLRRLGWIAKVAHLLVIEDQPDVVAVLKEALAAHYQVTCASSALDAMSVLERERPDAALIDAVLPSAEGTEIAERVLSRGIPVLLMTGNPGAWAALEESGCHFLAKPFRLDALLAETRALLEHAVERQEQLAVQLRRFRQNMTALAETEFTVHAAMAASRSDRQEREEADARRTSPWDAQPRDKDG